MSGFRFWCPFCEKDLVSPFTPSRAECPCGRSFIAQYTDSALWTIGTHDHKIVATNVMLVIGGTIIKGSKLRKQATDHWFNEVEVARVMKT